MNKQNRIERDWRPTEEEPPQPKQPRKSQPKQNAAPNQSGEGQTRKPAPPGKPIPAARPARPAPPDLAEAQQAKEQRQRSEDRSSKDLQRKQELGNLGDKELQRALNPGAREKKDLQNEFTRRRDKLTETGYMPKVYYRDEEDHLHFVDNDLQERDSPQQNARKHVQSLRKAAYLQRSSGIKHGINHFGSPTPATEKDLHDWRDQESKTLAETLLNPNPTGRAFDTMSGESIRKLNASFSVLAGKIAEDAVSWPVIGDDEWDIEAIMKRRYDHRPLSHCKLSREKSRLVLVLDSSPSCSGYAKFFAAIAQAALQFGDVEIYDAPNARLRLQFAGRRDGWQKINEHRSYYWGFANRHIVFFGDWDGAGIVIHNSQKNKLYWFDCDRRKSLNKKRRDEYTGIFGYRYADFKGRRFPCYSVKEFLKLAKKIR